MRSTPPYTPLPSADHRPGCIFRDAAQLTYKASNTHADECEELPDPAASVLEWRLLGTFRELLSWQRRTDNQLECDQFLDEHAPTPSVPTVLAADAPPAPPAPNMTALSHKTALFNWMRWLDVGQTVSAGIPSRCQYLLIVLTVL